MNYKQQNLVAALRGYNLAIAFGLPGEEELGLAYANRAALFLQIKEPSEALQDIELARANAFPQNLMSKLEERANKCKDMIDRLQIHRTGEEGEEPSSDQVLKEYSNNTYFTLKRRSGSIIGAEDYVGLVNSPDRGRRVIANQDIPAAGVKKLTKHHNKFPH
ncbi:unnamed protein product [Allacma fusca]|uniref:Tetratricopeptide repeat protein n=1 Tax=Allacma fusca TaxID=39272 RepID=A0A8J2KRJ1_9HEXA|nr:unnamed protein product [Allacma fusca]